MDYIYIPVQLDEIRLINNIISDEERERLIEVSKPLLVSGAELGRMYGGADYPGNQTLSNLHASNGPVHTSCRQTAVPDRVRRSKKQFATIKRFTLFRARGGR